MKKFPYLTFFSTWLLVFCGTFGAPMCVVTAYQLPYRLFAMVLTALLISGFMTLLFTMPELGLSWALSFVARHRISTISVRVSQRALPV